MTSIEKNEDEFILVKSKKKSGRVKGNTFRNFHSMRQELNQIEEQCSLEHRQVHLKKINSSVLHISSSEYFTEFLSSFTEGISKLKRKLPFDRIVCYGLGCFVDCIIARYQLAFLICMKNEYGVREVELFDPMFSSLEKIILAEDLKFSVIKVNEEGKRTADKLTLFYMPHCPHQLANNLLYSNWDVSSLENCVIISNSFKRVIANSKSQCSNEVLLYISQIETLMEEYNVKNTFQYTDIFNDTAIHIFPSDKLESAPKEIWTINDEPRYLSEEFISNNI